MSQFETITAPGHSLSSARVARRGYTLFELVLVLAILVVLAALAYPSLDSMYAGYRITAAADMVQASWASARARAMDEGRPYRFAVLLNKGNFRIAPEGADYWSGGDPAALGDPSAAGLVIEEVLPKGVRVCTHDASQTSGYESGGDYAMPVGSIDPSSWTSLVTFLPDGTAREDVVEIVLHAQGARPLLLRLRGLTGVVTPRTLDLEGR